MSKRTSPIWAYFTKQDDVTITCILCKTQLADEGGTLNLQKHLKRKHVDEAKKCFGNLEVGMKQTVMSMYSRKCPPSHAMKITMLIAKLVARDMRPLSILEDDGFQQFFSYVEPNYQAPSRPHVRSVCQKL